MTVALYISVALNIAFLGLARFALREATRNNIDPRTSKVSYWPWRIAVEAFFVNLWRFVTRSPLIPRDYHVRPKSYGEWKGWCKSALPQASKPNVIRYSYRPEGFQEPK